MFFSSRYASIYFACARMASALDVSDAIVNWARHSSGRGLISEANYCEYTRSLHWLSALVSDEQAMLYGPIFAVLIHVIAVH
jgi:hypothetical protein